MIWETYSTINSHKRTFRAIFSLKRPFANSLFLRLFMVFYRSILLLVEMAKSSYSLMIINKITIS